MTILNGVARRDFQCRDCIHFLPYPLIREVGTCSNPASLNYDRARFGDEEPCEFFGLAEIGGSGLPEADFYWCNTCRKYMYRDELVYHVGHRVYSGVAQTDVEFNVESTMAAD